MTVMEIKNTIGKGEGYQIEFKSSKDFLSKDVFDTVCAFSNREGGTILLGIDNSGKIIGVNPESKEKIKKDFVTSINNINKFYPPLYFPIEEIQIEGKIVLIANVPECNQVCRHKGRIIDRNNDSDIDITDNFELVRQLYIRKGGSYFVNTVTDFTLDDLQPYLFERVRIMTRNRSLSHPWINMNDEEILRASGLIMKDSVKQKEGLTLAAILLFGKDTTIVSALPHHKTDAIVRIENTNRYDDRDVIITNLLESYDRMVAFCQKHLSNPFILEGAQSISARDKILREVCANSLVHRNYASGFVSQLVIEKERMLLINPSISYISGKLNLSSFRPFSKNPQISKVFREIGLADELGSGMRNTCKYTELYSGGEPSFIEESGMFRTEIPLSNVSLLKTGPERSFNLISSNFEGHDEGHDKGHDKGHDVIMEHVNELQQKILAFCSSPKTKREIVEYFGYKNPRTFSALYIKPLLNKELLRLLFPDKPKSKYQRYVRVDSNPSVNLLIGSHEGYQGEDEEVQLGKVENAPQVTDEFKISSPQVETDCAESTPQVDKEKSKSTPQVTETESNIILFCTGTPRSVIEIMDFLDLSDKKSFRSRYLVPLLGKGVLKMTIPDKPTSRNQRYVRAENEEKDWK